MKSAAFAVLCAFFCIIAGVIGDAELSGDGATADVLGQSGKITMSYQGQSTQVTMSSVTEVDSSGNVVGNTGPAAGKHSFNSFASQDFTFSAVQQTTYQGLDVSLVNFTCPLVNNQAHLTVQLYLFLEKGNTTIDGRNYSVDPGSFKFSYYLDYWPFCTIGGTGDNLCEKGNQEQQGAYLDFDIILKGNKNAKNVEDDSIVYEDNSQVILPNRYQVDSNWFTMPTNYPLTTIQGSQQIVTFRFARFTGSLDYDPIVDWAHNAGFSNNPFVNIIVGVVSVVVLSAFLAL